MKEQIGFFVDTYPPMDLADFDWAARGRIDQGLLKFDMWEAESCNKTNLLAWRTLMSDFDF